MGFVTPVFEIARDRASIRNSHITSAIAECLGTFILCLFGVGAGCQALVTGQTTLVPVLGGTIGLIVAITICGGASGAHINPAVTLGVAISGGISWIKVPIYWVSQFFGAYLGSGLAYSLYANMFKKLDPGCYADLSLCPGYAAVFAPPPNTEVGVALYDQVIGTALLVMVILAAIDQRNMKIPAFCYGPLFAITIAGINFTFGLNAGGVLNPARDLGARLMAVSIGLPSKYVFVAMNPTTGNNAQYWLAPLFGPLLGGALAAVLYIGLIGAHLKDADEIKVPKARPAFEPDGNDNLNNTV